MPRVLSARAPDSPGYRIIKVPVWLHTCAAQIRAVTGETIGEIVARAADESIRVRHADLVKPPKPTTRKRA